MAIRFGKNPSPLKPRRWAQAMGFSWVEWLADDGLVLNETPRTDKQYKIRVGGNLVLFDYNNVTLCWLPAESSINGFDQSNVEDLERIRFVTGRVSVCDSDEKAILFQPETVKSPSDLLLLESRPVDETDTLADCQRWEYSFERFRCVEFSMEGDVTSQYLFLDEQLVMLAHCVWSDAHFWIGNGKLSPALARKVFPVNGV